MSPSLQALHRRPCKSLLCILSVSTAILSRAYAHMVTHSCVIPSSLSQHPLLVSCHPSTPPSAPRLHPNAHVHSSILQGVRRPALPDYLEVRKYFAVHECGKALVATKLRQQTGRLEQVERVSIVPRGRSVAVSSSSGACHSCLSPLRHRVEHTHACLHPPDCAAYGVEAPRLACSTTFRSV